MTNRGGHLWKGAAAILLAGWTGIGTLLGFVYETEYELIGTGDFDGNRWLDVVIVDKRTGKYRLGYQDAEGRFTWATYRASGARDISALATGRLLEANRDALVLTAADTNLVLIADASDPDVTTTTMPVPFEALGPSAVVAIDIGGAGNTPLDDLLVSSIYNDPTPDKLSLLRNRADQQFMLLSESEAKAFWLHANRVTLQPGGRPLVAALLTDKNGGSFRLEDLSSGKRVLVAEATGLCPGSDYVVGPFRPGPLADVVFYQRGTNAIRVGGLTDTGNGRLKLTISAPFDLGQPIKLAVAIPQERGAQLLVLFGKGESAEVYRFNAAGAPVPFQTLTPKSGDLWFGAVGLEKQFLLFAAFELMKFATHCQSYQATGATNAPGTRGNLASLADNDDWTIPDVHKRILEVATQEQVRTETDMRPYTNTIPGTTVKYVMLPIPSGEFSMGSGNAEAGRKTDEGPAHKVRVSPFWMGQCEVTWNEFDLVVWKNEDRENLTNRLKDEAANKLPDAVTGPTKPYTDMSFGMGRDRFPAVCMTQHAANKYCQWLAARTGHFYRLPTEAEWEYACRAGTSTAYSFGDDADQLADHAWFEQNSPQDDEFKYHRVGTKRPNPWGLYDMHGNVCEWCLDQYEADYAKFVGARQTDPWNRATLPYPHVVRGGCFDDEAARLRSAARRASNPAWKMRDPQFPKSIWWLTDAKFVGFRIVRPLLVPNAGQIQKYWTSGVQSEEAARIGTAAP
jgi:formylglycine-generating enzyme required for sulfatase activity